MSRPVLAAAVALLLLTGAAGPRALPTGDDRPAGPTTAPLASTTEADAPAAAVPGVRYDWPTGGPARVLRPFDPPPQRWAPGHRGVDLELGEGAVVVAAADGTVVFAGPLAGRPVVSVAHADGLRTTYEPVSAAVRRGDRVSRGAVLGTLAGPAHCPGGCLHWGALRGRDVYVDPLLLLGRPRVRLFPQG